MMEEENKGLEAREAVPSYIENNTGGSATSEKNVWICS